jgi:site-specific recombinase XerD
VYTRGELGRAFSVSRKAVKGAAHIRATQRAYQRFLMSRGRLQAAAVEDPCAPLLHGYRHYLSDQRGLCRETLEHHARTVIEFLHEARSADRDLAALTHEDVERYLALKSKSVTRHYLQHVVAHLRSFLRYCHERGEIELPLSVIDTPRAFHDELPPRAIAWPVVQALLRSIDRSSRSGWRDYAILHLLAHYGLRPCEVVALRLDSVDWQAKTLAVDQRKTQTALILPLHKETLSVLQHYLAHGRPASAEPELFLRARCPAGAIERYAVGDIFDKRAAESGLSLDGYSAYCLRHSFAMRLLNRGVGVKAIGDVLGHRSLTSTMGYLRLDTDTLRAVALPVPQVRGSGGRHV